MYKNTYRNFTGVLLFIFISLTGTACSDRGPSSESTISHPQNTALIELDQGWDDNTRLRAHHTSFGSQLLPYEWMLNLEQANNIEKLLDNRHMSALGFLTGVKSEYNPDSLPVGFTQSIDDNERAWMGLGCAACHTGEVHFQGKKFRIDGGSALIDFAGFETAVLDSLASTLQSSEKIDRFTQQLAANDQEKSALVKEMNQQLALLKSRQAINATDVPYGHGRLDAFGQIFNAVSVNLLQIPENRRSPDAPVSFPVLWDAPHFDLVQWNGSAPNAGPGPLFQNITTALAVFGKANVLGSDSKFHYPSTVNIKNLSQIQNWLYQLQSPLWPEKYFGALASEKVNYGKTIYQQQCLSCHSLVERDNPDRKIKVNLTNLEEIGTDPRMVENYLNAVSKSGVLEGQKTMLFAGEVIKSSAPTIDLVSHVAIGTGLGKTIDTIEAAIADYHSVYKASVNPSPNYYKGRPLDGIWSSAPYLHNGSVPNLRELLLPASQRLKQFYVGSREFDPDNVGLSTKQAEHSSLFDTQLAGNSNSGHEYGTDLSRQDKESLLEYLRSL